MSEPATKQDLAESSAELKTAWKQDLAESSAELKTAWKQDLAESSAELKTAWKQDLAEAKAELKAAWKQDLAGSSAELRAELASKQDLAEAKAELRAELASKQDLADLERRLTLGLGGLVSQAIADSERRMVQEMKQLARSIGEDFRAQLGAFDEKYKHLPAEVAQLRADLDEHRADPTLHAHRRLTP